MRLLFAAVMLLVLIGLAFLGYYRVPGVAGASGIDPQFQTSAFLEILSFVLTAAFIGPLTAEFVEWRHRQEWKPARQTARERLNKALSAVVQSYGGLITLTANPSVGSPSLEMDMLVQHLDRFLDIYDEEHPVFDPEMHSAGSSVRRTLAEFRNTMRVARSIAQPNRSVRLLVRRNDLDKLRALFGRPRLGPAAAPPPLGRDPMFNPDEPVVIETDRHFFAAGELYFDAQLREFGIGSMLPVFEPLDLASLRDRWERFLAGAPAAQRPPNPFDMREPPSADAQRTAYIAWLTLFSGDNDLVMHLIERDGAKAAAAAAGSN